MRTRRARLVSLRASSFVSSSPSPSPSPPAPPRGAFVPSRFLPSSSARARVYIPRARTRGRRPMTSSRPIARPASRARARSLASRANERTKFHAFESPPIASSSSPVARRRVHIRMHIRIRIRIRDASRRSSRRTSERSPSTPRGRVPPRRSITQMRRDVSRRFRRRGRVRRRRSRRPSRRARARPPRRARARARPRPGARPTAAWRRREVRAQRREIRGVGPIAHRFLRARVRSTLRRPIRRRRVSPVASRRHRHARDLARVSALDDAPRAFVRSVRVDSRGVQY